MNLKEISLEELVDSCICTCGLVKEDMFGEQHKAEILRRDKEKDEKIKELEDENGKLKDAVVYSKPYDEALCLLKWKQRAEQAEAEVERLKDSMSFTESKALDRVAELEAKLKSISEYVVVMRSDLSSVLGDDRGWIMYKDKETALIASRSFCGVVKTKHEAELIIKDNIIKKLTLRAETTEAKARRYEGKLSELLSPDEYCNFVR